jgi:hypothetical protein
MRSAELNRQAQAILADLERQLRAQGFRFGWHEKHCLIVGLNLGELQRARRLIDLLLAPFPGQFRATESVIKTLPNGYTVAEFELSSTRRQRKRRSRSSKSGAAFGQCTKGCVLRK